MYKLSFASKKDIPLLVKYKLATIFEYTKDIDEEEKKKIINYVNQSIPDFLTNYKLIVNANNIIGCILISAYRDGILLDELYVEAEYRNLGIGSHIISDLTSTYDIIYLWVYKLNKKAIRLYKSFDFKINDTTETRFLMKYKNIK